MNVHRLIQHLNNCFKVTQILTMRMLGSGVEFGQRTESWLAYKKGLVKSEIYIRWTEHPYNADWTQNGPPDDNNEAWVGLNKIELTSLDVTPSAGVFRNNQSQYVLCGQVTAGFLCHLV